MLLNVNNFFQFLLGYMMPTNFVLIFIPSIKSVQKDGVVSGFNAERSEDEIPDFSVVLKVRRSNQER